MIHMGGTVIPLCGNIPSSASFLKGCFASSFIGLDAFGSLNYLNSRWVEMARASLLHMLCGNY